MVRPSATVFREAACVGRFQYTVAEEQQQPGAW